MGTFNDAYDITKDLLGQAKKSQNQPMIELAMDVQAKLFKMKEEFEATKEENKALKTEIERIKQITVNEERIKFFTRGFFVLKDETPVIPYCSACWKIDRWLIPLHQSGGWMDFDCPKCKSHIRVLDENGGQLGAKSEGTK